MLDDASGMYYWVRLYQNMPPNVVSAPNLTDGTAAYVVSRRDPGVHNWLDPNGLRETLFVARWQRLPRDAARKPSIAVTLVKLRKLDDLLPPDVARVTAQERRAQLDERLAHYRLRLVV